MTTCPYCLKDLTDEETFVQQIQSQEIIQFQQDLLKIYNSETIQERPIEVQVFFQHLWRIAASASVDPSIGEFSSETTLSTERVHKALYLVLKAVQADGSLIHAPFRDVIKSGVQIAKDFQGLRSTGEITPIDWEIAESRYKIIRPLLGMVHRTALDVTNVAKQENLSQKTVYNWLARYKSGGLKALIPQHKKSGRKPAVYPSEVEDLSKAYINKHISLVSESNPEPIRKSWIRFNDDCLSNGWNPSQIPKIGTFYKKYRLIQENFIMKGQLSSSPAAIETKDAVNSPL